MKIRTLASSAFAAFLIAAGAYNSHAQSLAPTNDVPRAISYQGTLADNAGKALPDGSYRITLSLYADPAGSVMVWQDTYDAPVINGVFNLYLGAGSNPLPDPARLNAALWIGTQVGDAPLMHPLTPLSASPYALNVPDRAITTGKLADGAVTADKVDMEYIGGIAVNGQPVTAKGTVLNLEGSNDIAIDFDNRTNTLRLSRPTPATEGDGEKSAEVQGSTFDFWTMRGNGRTDGGGTVTPVAGDWIGTSNSVGFEMRTNNQRVMYYQPNGTNTPNIVGGYSGNTISASSIASTIAGGGASTIINEIDNNASYAFIGGGVDNLVSANSAVIGGGNNNTATGVAATVGGGQGNQATGNSSTIAGGTNNITSGVVSTVAGGINNTTPGQYAFIGGGVNNTVTANFGAIVGGGDYNFPNSVAGNYSLIGTGYGNTIALGQMSAIVAGGGNDIHDNADLSLIGAGAGNAIHSFSSIIGAGESNQILVNSDYSAIAAGYQNETSARYAFIGSGEANTISGEYSAIAGGNDNTISGFNSFVGSGFNNTISQHNGVIGGGGANQVINDYGFIGGGYENTVSGRNAVIGGGEKNLASANFAAVGGGYRNQVVGNFATVGGGITNWAASDNATIGGGYGNTATGLTSTIPGGDSLQTPSYAQTAIGFYNAPRGFVPSQPATKAARTAINAPLFMVGNGVPNLVGTGVTRSNAFEVSYNGHSVVYDVNGTTNVAAFNRRVPFSGATYVDNILYAWGEVDAAGNVNADFGVASVIHAGPGTYIVRIDLQSPAGASILLNSASITATVVDKGEDPEATCRLISSTKISGNQFTIRIKDLTCKLVDTPFMFKVSGRP